MKSFQLYLKEVVQEMSKVSWPTKDELKGSTIVVVTFSIIMALLVWGMDYGLTVVLKMLTDVLT